MHQAQLNVNNWIAGYQSTCEFWIALYFFVLIVSSAYTELQLKKVGFLTEVMLCFSTCC